MDKKRFAHIAVRAFLIMFVVALFLPAFFPAPWWSVIAVESALILSVCGAVHVFVWKKEDKRKIPDIYVCWISMAAMASATASLGVLGPLRWLMFVITAAMAIFAIIGVWFWSRGKTIRNILTSYLVLFLFGSLTVYLIPFMLLWNGLPVIWWICLTIFLILAIDETYREEAQKSA